MHIVVIGLAHSMLGWFKMEMMHRCSKEVVLLFSSAE